MTENSCPDCKHDFTVHRDDYGPEWWAYGYGYQCEFMYANTGKGASGPSGQAITSCGCKTVDSTS